MFIFSVYLTPRQFLNEKIINPLDLVERETDQVEKHSNGMVVAFRRIPTK